MIDTRDVYWTVIYFTARRFIPGARASPSLFFYIIGKACLSILIAMCSLRGLD